MGLTDFEDCKLFLISGTGEATEGAGTGPTAATAARTRRGRKVKIKKHDLEFTNFGRVSKCEPFTRKLGL